MSPARGTWSIHLTTTRSFEGSSVHQTDQDSQSEAAEAMSTVFEVPTMAKALQKGRKGGGSSVEGGGSLSESSEFGESNFR